MEGGSANDYDYCAGDPVNCYDLTGRVAIAIPGVGVVIVAGLFAIIAARSIANFCKRVSCTISMPRLPKGAKVYEAREHQDELPLDGERPYEPPQKGKRELSREEAWDKKRKGFKDDNGDIWVWDTSGHRGPHWDVNLKGGGHENVSLDGRIYKKPMIMSSVTAEQILALLRRPVDERPYVQFRLRDQAPMASLVQALRAADSPAQLVVLASVMGMRYRSARSAVPALMELLRHPDDEVRYVAADSLGKIGASMSGGALIEALRDETATRVRAMLLAGIGAVGAVEGLPALCSALRNSDPGTRQAAAWGLGRLSDERALQPLEQAALSEDDPWVREAMLTAARQVRGSGA